MGKIKKSKRNPMVQNVEESSDSSEDEVNMFIDNEAEEGTTEDNDSSVMSTEEEEEEIMFAGGSSAGGDASASRKKRPRADESRIEEEKSAKKRKALNNGSNNHSSPTNSDASVNDHQRVMKIDSSTSTADVENNVLDVSPTMSTSSVSSADAKCEVAGQRAERILLYQGRAGHTWRRRSGNNAQIYLTISCSDIFFKVKGNIPNEHFFNQ